MTSSSEKIILDCDPGEDDALAILLTISKGLNLSALICGFGNISANKTHLNGARLLTLANRKDIPLMKGAEKPYRPHPFEKDTVSAGDFVGENGLCGVDLEYDQNLITKTSQMDQDKRISAIVDHLKIAGRSTYIVTGPCTTLAHVLEKLGDDAAGHIKEIIIMGGALDAAGNTGPINPETLKPYAEFNFYCDPHAVDKVFESNLPITLVSWDLTEKIVLTYKELPDLKSSTKQGDFILKLVSNFLESYGNANERSFEFNDCITITAFQKDGFCRKETVRILLDGPQTARLVRDVINGRELDFFELPSSDLLPVRNAILSTLGISAK